MAHSKFDGVIEAVRYSSNGHIVLVRMYERHGAAWSDHILLERKNLVACMKNGKRFVTGQRKVYFGGIFETDQAVRYQGNGNGFVVTESQSANRDLLAGVPVF